MKNQQYKGLTQAEVARRIREGKTNQSSDKTSRTVGEIVRANVVTRFNALLALLFIIVMIFGQPLDGTFGIIIFFNSMIGIIQELRAKRTLDRLALITAPRTVVIRDGEHQQIPSSEIVEGDIIELAIGDQVPADGEVISREGLEVDESLLTGESDAIAKRDGASVMSGSFVTAGRGLVRVTAVGEQAYARQITNQVKQFKRTESELINGTNRLLKYISIIIVVVGPLLIWGQLTRTDAPFNNAVIHSVAAIVGMIPEGLVLMTSLAFMIAVLTLARRRVLVQELPAVEGLARVDVICLDKTGTLTNGEIMFERYEALGRVGGATIARVLAAIARTNDSSSLRAIHEAHPTPTWTPDREVPFNSTRKWSAHHQPSGDWWILGAPEMVMTDEASAARQAADTWAEHGKRVMVLARSRTELQDETLPTDVEAVALVILAEEIRADARETLAFFHSQGVATKIVSGDNPRTVAAVAAQVGVKGEVCDARTLKSDTELAEAVERYAVFGRVLPEQKRAFVRALQAQGHVVAMTGDGVNDALALKDADIGIAMGSGAQATKSIAQLVLLDNQFGVMPQVLAEGRRVIANIERVASLFVIKNVYTLALALAVTVFGMSFPFLPRHYTFVAALTIGIPAFFLALAPNNQRYRPGFLKRVLWFSVPIGVIIAAGVMLSYVLLQAHPYNLTHISTAGSIVLMTIGTAVILCLAVPWRWWKLLMISAIIYVEVLSIRTHLSRALFELSYDTRVVLVGLCTGAVGSLLAVIVWWYARRAE